MLKKFLEILKKNNNLLVLFLGLLSSLSFAPINIFPIIFFCYVLLIKFVLKSSNPSQAFYVGFLFGFGQAVSALYWISMAFVKAEVGGLFSGIPAVILISIYIAIFLGFSSLAIFLMFNKFKKSNLVLVLTFFFSLFDWVKGNFMEGFPWLVVSSIWTFSEITLKPLSLLGTWGYCFITYLAIFSLVEFKSSKRNIFYILPLLLFLVFGHLNTGNFKLKYSDISFRAVQPNIPQQKKWDKNELKNNLDITMSLSNNESQFSDFDITIWPETAIPFKIEGNNNLRIYIDEGLKKSNYLISGGIRSSLKGKNKNKQEKHIYNSLYVFNSKGEVINFYDKNILVPFGEYIPFRNLVAIKKLTEGNTDFSKGEKYKVINIENLISIGPLICYEVIFPGKLIKKDKRPDMLINITNDAWYGNTSGPYQHLALSQMRASEEGLTLLRVANTGVSALISPNGKILKSIQLNNKGVIDSYVPKSLNSTIYSKYGDSFFWLMMCISVLAIFYKRISL